MTGLGIVNGVQYADQMPDTLAGSRRILQEFGYFEAPASSKYHLAELGGLYIHSCNVTKALLYITEKLGLKWGREESPYIVGMLHDLCKCDAYAYTKESGYAVNKDGLFNPKLHGVKSVILAQRVLSNTELKTLTEEEILCITYHMGAYTEKDDWHNFDIAMKKYPNVYFTHVADMIATKFMEG